MKGATSYNLPPKHTVVIPDPKLFHMLFFITRDAFRPKYFFLLSCELNSIYRLWIKKQFKLF